MFNLDIWKLEIKQEHIDKVNASLQEIINEIQSQTPTKQLWRLMKATSKNN